MKSSVVLASTPVNATAVATEKLGTRWESDISELCNHISGKILSNKATEMAYTKYLKTLAQKQNSEILNGLLDLRLVASSNEKAEYNAVTTDK